MWSQVSRICFYFYVHPQTFERLLELVKRLRALTLTLIPVQIDPKDLVAPTSRIISPHVIQKFEQSAGDYQEAVSSSSLTFFSNSHSYTC